MKKIIGSVVLILMTISALHAQSATKHFLAEAVEFQKTGNYKKALLKVDKALGKEVTVEAYLLKAMILEDMKEYQQVYDTFVEAVGFDPENSIILTNRAIFLTRIAEYDAADLDVMNAIKFAQTDSLKCVAHAVAGGIKGYIGQVEESIRYLKKAHECDSTQMDVLVNLGATYTGFADYEMAFYYLNKAQKLEPNNYMVIGNIGFLFQDQGRHIEAIEKFEKVLEIVPNEPQTIGNIAFSQYKLGQLDIAMENINKSIELYPANSYSYRTRALIYFELGNLEKACHEMGIALAKGFTQMHGPSAEKFQEDNCN